MAPKTTAIGIGIVLALLLAAVCLRAIADPVSVETRIAWDPVTAQPEVGSYWIQYRPIGDRDAWTTVEVPGGATEAAVPAAAVGTVFRVAASNAFGLGPWSQERALPPAITSLRIITEIR